jgi:hypothetical protein
MHVENQLHPSPEQAMAFFSEPDEGPFVMINLLKFKDKAAYADGSDADLSGRDAYLRYGMAVARRDRESGRPHRLCRASHRVDAR